MIKAATMFTYELDDVERAIAELKEQLQKQTALMKNTVGIIVCDPEFVRIGAVKAICARLPFPIAGATSVAQSAGGETGRLMLTLMVLTSDDVFFAVGASKAASKESVFAAAGPPYKDAARRLGAKPELILLFTPFNLEIPGNFYVDAFCRLCPGAPIFGTLAVDDLPKFADCLTIMNGNAYSDAISFVLIGGNVAPRFFASALSWENMQPYGGEITKAQGNVLMEINGERALPHFEKSALIRDGQLAPGLSFLPLVIDRKKRACSGDAPIINELIRFDGDGFAVCRLDLSRQTDIEVGIFASEDILGTSQAMIEKLNAEQDIQAIIIFSCTSRRMSLYDEPLKELYLMAEVINKDTPYMVAY
ncbi:MAG: hypothetical protein LBP78_05950, partial [Acidaminococcales bacterium]|nr:hypothetical protein [Acidaminococcales bacterium]